MAFPPSVLKPRRWHPSCCVTDKLPLLTRPCLPRVQGQSTQEPASQISSSKAWQQQQLLQAAEAAAGDDGVDEQVLFTFGLPYLAT